MAETAIAKPQQHRPMTIKDYLQQEKVKAAIASVLPQHMKPERLIKVALVAISRSPKLSQCTPDSILKSLMISAELGLDPSGNLGQAYLVPYQNKYRGTYECQLIPGYRGLITLARRSGHIKAIEARVVREKDVFRVRYGLEPELVHKPVLGGEKDREIVAAYAVAVLADGTKQFDVMSRQEIDAIRARSKAADDGPWVTDYAEMAKKTVVRRLCKYLPLSPEEPIAKALEVENRAEAGEPVVDLIELPQEEEPESRTEQLVAKLEASKSEPEQPEPEMQTVAAVETSAEEEANGEGAGPEPEPDLLSTAQDKRRRKKASQGAV